MKSHLTIPHKCWFGRFFFWQWKCYLVKKISLVNWYLIHFQICIRWTWKLLRFFHDMDWPESGCFNNFGMWHGEMSWWGVGPLCPWRSTSSVHGGGGWPEGWPNAMDALILRICNYLDSWMWKEDIVKVHEKQRCSVIMKTTMLLLKMTTTLLVTMWSPHNCRKMFMRVIVRKHNTSNTIQCRVVLFADEVSCPLASLISWQDGSPARRGGACLASFRLQPSGVCRPPINIHTGRQETPNFQ